MSNAGHAIVIDQDSAMYQARSPITLPINVMVIYANPASMNVIAHTNSCFQLMIRMAIKINEGIECRRNPPIWIRILSPVPNMSNQNIVRKRMKSIARILGARVRNVGMCFFMSIGQEINSMSIIFSFFLSHSPAGASLFLRSDTFLCLRCFFSHFLFLRLARARPYFPSLPGK